MVPLNGGLPALLDLAARHDAESIAPEHSDPTT